MKGKLVWILLGVSLAANLFFAAGALYSFYGGEHRGWRAKVSVDDVVERLALSPAQREALQELRDKARDRPRPSREEREQRREPEFDRARMQALMVERMAVRQERILDRAEALHGYLATLDPKQRAGFLEMAKERGFLFRLFGRPQPTRAR
ncbi:MAG: Spy/CpxP family protein refolding chaperone [Alphaproteobacteria bacterium]